MFTILAFITFVSAEKWAVVNRDNNFAQVQLDHCYTGYQPPMIYKYLNSTTIIKTPCEGQSQDVNFFTVEKYTDQFVAEDYAFCQYTFSDKSCTVPKDSPFMCYKLDQCAYNPGNDMSYLWYEYGVDPMGWPYYSAFEAKGTECIEDSQGWMNTNLWYMDYCSTSSGSFKNVDCQTHNGALSFSIVLFSMLCAFFL